MSIRNLFSIIVMIAVPSIVGPASAQMIDQAAREEARKVVLSRLHLRSDQFLALQRDETLEHSLALIVGKRAESERIYRVSREGEEIKENGIALHMSVDAELVFIVAVDSAGESSYCIHGFPDSAGEFDRLMTALKAEVSSSEQAESLSEFYRAVNPQNMPVDPISSLIELKQAAERHCHSGVKSFDAGQKAFIVWWKHARPLYEALSFQQRATAHDGGHRVEWIFLSSPSAENCGGAPLRATLEVSSDGHVSKLIVSPLRER